MSLSLLELVDAGAAAMDCGGGIVLVISIMQRQYVVNLFSL